MLSTRPRGVPLTQRINASLLCRPDVPPGSGFFFVWRWHANHSTHMSKIHESPIHELHPTQLTVGMIEVQDKKKRLMSLAPKDRQTFMHAHPIPAVLGPGDKLYSTDHHHLGRAALEGGVTIGYFEVEADLSDHCIDDFWKEMDKNLWMHPLDEHGVRHYYAAIPDHLGKLIDDPYRSLAGYVRDAGGYKKTPTAFAEFAWADFFRRTIPIESLQADFAAAVHTALSLTHSKLASGLPGLKTK